MVLAAGMLFGVWGYTSAQVGNEANLTIVDSANALVAVDILPSESINIPRGLSGLCGTITNNKSEIIDIEATVEFDCNLPWLYPGDSTDLIITIPSEDEPGLQEYCGTITADWSGGQAEINFSVWVNVEELEEEGQ
ncbi:MAG: hypothetical protein WCY82_04825 [Desulfotomaculaceae bacterium]